MLKYAFMLDVHKFAKLLQTIIAQDTEHKLSYCKVNITISNNNVHMFVPLYASKTGFVYDAPITDAFIKPVNGATDIDNGQPITFFVDNYLLKQMVSMYLKDTFYNVLLIVKRTTQFIKSIFEITHALNNKDISELTCDVTVKEYRADEQAMLELNIDYTAATHKFDVTQVIQRNALLELFDIYAQLPLGNTYTNARFFITDNINLYYCQGPTCLRKKWVANPFDKLTKQGLCCILIDALTFFKCYTDVSLYKMTRQRNGLITLSTIVGNIQVTYVWKFEVNDIEQIRNLVDCNITSDLQNSILSMKMSDLQTVARSGLRKFARVPYQANICWSGCAGDMIMCTVNYFNQDSFDKNNLVRDIWGLPLRTFQMHRLQAVVRLLKMYKVNKVLLTSKEVTNQFASVTFCNVDNSFCISLLPVRV